MVLRIVADKGLLSGVAVCVEERYGFDCWVSRGVVDVKCPPEMEGEVRAFVAGGLAFWSLLHREMEACLNDPKEMAKLKARAASGRGQGNVAPAGADARSGAALRLYPLPDNQPLHRKGRSVK